MCDKALDLVKHCNIGLTSPWLSRGDWSPQLISSYAIVVAWHALALKTNMVNYHKGGRTMGATGHDNTGETNTNQKVVSVKPNTG